MTRLRKSWYVVFSCSLTLLLHMPRFLNKPLTVLWIPNLKLKIGQWGNSTYLSSRKCFTPIGDEVVLTIYFPARTIFWGQIFMWWMWQLKLPTILLENETLHHNSSTYSIGGGSCALYVNDHFRKTWVTSPYVFFPLLKKPLPSVVPL